VVRECRGREEKKSEKKSRVCEKKERRKKEEKFYISPKSPYNLGIIFTITKVRGGDIYHFIFFIYS